jgi:hypothetical protein
MALIKRICSVTGCENPVKGHGLCNKHLQRQRKYGDPSILLVSECEFERKPRGEPWTLEMIYDRSFPVTNSGCWFWMGALQSTGGYAAVRYQTRAIRVHRLAYELAHGITVPSNLDVCHKCDVPFCVNPDHLFVGTRADNMQDCAQKGRAVLPGLYGEDCPASKLTEEQVLAIRHDPRSQREIARSYGVDRGTIAGIKKRKTWRHL